MKRTFYFLKDSVTGNFYNGENCNDIGHFDTAAVYWKRENAEKRINRLVNVKYSGSWEWTEKWVNDPTYLDYIKDQNERNAIIEPKRVLVNERKSLPNWGIEIVAVQVEA